MKHFLPLISVVAFSFLLLACTGSKKFAKQGIKLEEQGMVEEAAYAYYTSLQRNRNNLEAKIGLKNTGQVVLMKKLQSFSKARMTMSAGEAVAAYHQAEAYLEQVRALGVSLDFPSIYQNDYEEVKDIHLSELYEEGTLLLEEEKFESAEDVFRKILALDPQYGDVNELKRVAKIEPSYRKAETAFENGRFREAFGLLENVLALDANYKYAASMSDECLSLGQFTLAMTPFKDGVSNTSLTSKVNAYVLQALININDPFLKVVDRENIDDIIEEQKLQLSSVMDQSTAVEVGNIIGANAIITGTLLSYTPETGSLSSQTKTGFIESQVKKYNKEEDKNYYVKEYKKTSYREYFAENKVRLTIQYKVISLLTGEVLASEIVNEEVNDQIHYAVFSGGTKNLFPANSDNRANTSGRAKRQLDQLLAGSRDIRTIEELAQDIFDKTGRDVSREVGQLIQQIVK